MNGAQSDVLHKCEALSAFVDQMARGAALKDEALVSLAATLRAARQVARALDGGWYLLRVGLAREGGGGGGEAEEGVDWVGSPLPLVTRLAHHSCPRPLQARRRRRAARRLWAGAGRATRSSARPSSRSPPSSWAGACVCAAIMWRLVHTSFPPHSLSLSLSLSFSLFHTHVPSPHPPPTHTHSIRKITPSRHEATRKARVLIKVSTPALP
jgi:hypothetical protein